MALMLLSRCSLFVAATIGLVMIVGCDASSSSTLSTQSIAVAVDRVYIAPDRRTVVVFAGTDPLGSCLAADNGASVTVSEGVLIVEARRLVSGAPPSTCLPMCNVAKSTVTLAEPLAPDISFARSPPGAVTTCSSSLDPTAAIPIEPCRPADPTPQGEAITTTLPVGADPNLLVSC